LNQETDYLEEDNRKLDDEIAMYEEMARLNNGEQRVKCREMEEDSIDIKDQILKGHKEIDEQEVEFD